VDSIRPPPMKMGNQAEQRARVQVPVPWIVRERNPKTAEQKARKFGLHLLISRLCLDQQRSSALIY